MAVTVKRHSNHSDEHEGGGHVSIKEGHLVVLEGGWSTAAVVAVYAPGSWVSAVVEKDEKK